MFRTLVDAGLVDTVEVAIMPVLLSQGVPLLAPGAPHHRDEARQMRDAAEERHRDAVVHDSP